MLQAKNILLFFFTMLTRFCLAQSLISGTVSDDSGVPIANVVVYLSDTTKGVLTNTEGYFTIKTPAEKEFTIVFRHVEYTLAHETLMLEQEQHVHLSIRLSQETHMLQEVEVLDKATREQEPGGAVKLDPKDVEFIPSVLGDFTQVLATLPGVSSNSELSASYSVRGGNYDENLVYVNNIPIYRPFLVRDGQQGGLSFVNTDMVSSINFSSGGWQSKYGDKLSSVLNINYKQRSKFGASVKAGLLGGAAHAEGSSKNKRFSTVAGFRHKDSRYLLLGLDVKGQYFPTFTDLQSFSTYRFSHKSNKNTQLSLLLAYSRNRYFVRPDGQQTSFFAGPSPITLYVDFDGTESVSYDTYQLGANLNHVFNEYFETSLIFSGVTTREREHITLERGYRLCDASLEKENADPNACFSILGLGTLLDYARNELKADIISIESRSTWDWHENHKLEFGFGTSRQEVKDRLKEYSFTDSADFVTIDHTLRSHTNLNTVRFFAYLQNTSRLTPKHALSYGLRLNYWNLNNELIISPRIQYSYMPTGRNNIVWRLALGLYTQPPFYRELRNYQGDINEKLRAQKSLHMIAGLDQVLKMWNRDFRFSAEAYYKHIVDVIPYEVDNVKIRYLAKNDAKAFATGLDIRLSGEFIKGAESWFSLGILKTMENLENDNRGWIRRPTDQLLRVGIFFQDHIPNDPTLRAYINFQYGTGFPFGYPRDINRRSTFSGASYERVDLGISKLILFNDPGLNLRLHSLWISLEMLNVLGRSNPISYTWIEDFTGREFAIPNSQTQRFINLKIIGKFK